MNGNVFGDMLVDVSQKEASNNCSSTKSNGNQIHVRESALVRILSGKLDRSDTSRCVDHRTELCGVVSERTSRKCINQFRDDVDVYDSILEGGHSEVGAGSRSNLLFEDVVKHGDADNLPDGADDDRKGDGGSDKVVWGDD